MSDAWRKVSEYAITRGRQIICKCGEASPLFVLWDGELRIGHYDQADKAKAVADERLNDKKRKAA